MLNRPITDCSHCAVGLASPGRCPFVPTRHARGALVCSQGERPDTLFLVRKGVVSLSAADSGGSERAFALRGPGSLICLEALRGRPSAYEVRAVSEVGLCGLASPEIDKWLGSGPETARSLLALLMDEIERDREDVSWRQGEALARVARMVLEYPSLALAGAAEGIDKQSLARFLHMRPETFSRCLRKLLDDGLVGGSTRLRVLDKRRLSALAGRGLE